MRRTGKRVRHGCRDAARVSAASPSHEPRHFGSAVSAVGGPAIFGPLLIPVLLIALPLLIRGKSWRGASVAAKVPLAVFAVTGVASIGLFHLPALLEGSVLNGAVTCIAPPCRPKGSASGSRASSAPATRWG